MSCLSRLILNTTSLCVRHDLGDCQAMHRRVMSAFPRTTSEAGKAREEFGVLYRVEHNARTNVVALLVQSLVPPDWSELPERYLSNAGGAENPACKFIGEQYDALPAGALLRFRLRANPTRKIDTKSGPNGERRNGQRVELRDETQQLEWLARKGGQHGFQLRAVRASADVANVRAVSESKITGRRGWKNGAADGARAPRLVFGSVLFDGELLVSDVELFRQALARGVGSSKAYGFGLLSVAHLTQSVPRVAG